MPKRRNSIESDLIEPGPQYAPDDEVRAETKHLEEEFRENRDAGVEHDDLVQDEDPKLVLDKMFHEPVS